MRLPILLFALSASPLAAQQPVEFIRPQADAPYSSIVRVGSTVYLSGTLGTVPGSGLVPGGIQPETRQTLENIRGVLAQVGGSMDDLVKCTVFLADVGEWAAMNEVYVTFFPNSRPARSAIGVGGLPLGARVEIECIGELGAGAASR